jgi:protein associated with RNAse G/E
VNLKTLLKNKSYEKVLLSMDPEKLSEKDNIQYRIIYDMLSVKLKKAGVKKLYCLDEYQKNPEEYQYSNLLCDMLNDYLREGKVASFHIKLLEEYFFKHDLKERYLLQVAKDLKN